MERRAWLAVAIVGLGLISALLVNWVSTIYFPQVANYRWWLVAALVLVTALLAWVTYVQSGSGEAEANRPSVTQRASRGGEIDTSPIQAPAESNARIEQEAKGKESKIKDSGITLS